jgi:hypothetical protein
MAQETVSYEEEGEEAEEEEEAHLVQPAPNSLRIQLAPLEMNNTDDTLTILPEEYRVPDVRFCGKVGCILPNLISWDSSGNGQTCARLASFP